MQWHCGVSQGVEVLPPVVSWLAAPDEAPPHRSLTQDPTNPPTAHQQQLHAAYQPTHPPQLSPTSSAISRFSITGAHSSLNPSSSSFTIWGRQGGGARRRGGENGLGALVR